MATLDKRGSEKILEEPYLDTDFNIVIVATPSDNISHFLLGHDRAYLDVFVISKKVGLSNFVGRLCIRMSQQVFPNTNHWVSLEDDQIYKWAKIIYDDLSENVDLKQLIFKREIVKLSQTDRLNGLMSGQGTFALSRQTEDGYDLISESTYTSYNIQPDYYITSS